MATLFSSADGDATGRDPDRMDWVIDHQGPREPATVQPVPGSRACRPLQALRGYPSLPSDREDLWVP
jgi:hypothetical protein